ncbi:MAG: MBL fold metallo-hydrolase [Candidatus Aenigmarchaeota archaeon]|nr:MBL fold metallo-hydrolase [Candidatus Aenigmarchaeota archaeon]
MELKVSYGNGIALKIKNQTILLDPKVSDFISFVSHAHVDHSPKEVIRKPYCTRETYELIKVRDPFFEANIIEENKKIEFDGFSVKLISSGHILGSTQVLIETDNTSILYTGDFKLWQGLTNKAIKIYQAEILITEATYGKSFYKFPLVEEARKDLMEWVFEQLKKGFEVKLGGYIVGKSQEIIKLLNKNGIIPQISDSIRKYSEVYNEFGVNLKFLEKGEDSEVFVMPMHTIPYLEKKNSRCCVVTGWALTRNYNVKAFPISDHCDFEQLMLFIQEVRPKKVICVHGYAKDLAEEIRRRFKIQAQVLGNGQRVLTDFI